MTSVMGVKKLKKVDETWITLQVNVWEMIGAKASQAKPREWPGSLCAKPGFPLVKIA